MQNKRTFGLDSSAPRNMTSFVCGIGQIQYRNSHFMGKGAVKTVADDFIEATAPGQASEKCRRLHELTTILEPGDRLVVSELSRIGRSLGQIVAPPTRRFRTARFPRRLRPYAPRRRGPGGSWSSSSSC